MLRAALTMNVIFSLCCASLALSNISWLTAQVLLPTAVLAVLALGLLIFAGVIVWVIMSESRLLKYTRSIISSDLLWVVCTSILAVVFYQKITFIALMLIVGTNVCVGTLAVFQAIGFLTLKRGSRDA